MRRAAWIVLAVLTSWLTAMTARAGSLRAELVTVGPGSDELSLYGHSALCLVPEGTQDGQCYDFGVPAGDGDPASLVWDTLEGRPRFVPIAVERSRLVATYQDLERSIWVQELPLDDPQVGELRASLEAAVVAREPYAYHPYYDNCTTRIRDVLDRATSGKLHRADAPAAGIRFRALSEQGFSGRVFELAGLALFLGVRSDRVPTPWERMFLPADLRDAVAARLGAPAKQIYERREARMTTSPAAGRVGLVLLGTLLAAAIVLGARKSERRLRIALALSGVVLGLLGLAVDAVSLMTRIPEFSANWVVLVLLPTDVLLAFAAPLRMSRYLAVRLAMLAVLAALSAVGVIAQPLVAVCAFAALPLGAGAFFVRRTSKGRPPATARA